MRLNRFSNIKQSPESGINTFHYFISLSLVRRTTHSASKFLNELSQRFTGAKTIDSHSVRMTRYSQDGTREVRWKHWRQGCLKRGQPPAFICSCGNSNRPSQTGFRKSSSTSVSPEPSVHQRTNGQT